MASQRPAKIHVDWTLLALTLGRFNDMEGVILYVEKELWDYRIVIDTLQLEWNMPKIAIVQMSD